MTKYDLSILIPARNEMFLGKTIENILENIEGATEVITVCDGFKPDPPLPLNPHVTLIYHSQPIGQRAATNEAAKLSKAKYLMKCDAHCAFDKGFDVKLMADMHDDWTMAPLMKNLHAFDWVCPEGHRRYQGPSGPCQVCGKPTTRDMIWQGKRSPNSVSYCFDPAPHFQYFGDFSKRPEGQGDITPSMSLQGSCWMLTRDKYWGLNVCDENFGSWGSQGIEVAVKTWLSGGSVMVNKKTWYAHMFRTQGGDFGFPYSISGSDQEKAKNYARDLFFNNKWPKQVRPLSWLVEKFWPVKGWTEEDLAALKATSSGLLAQESAAREDNVPFEEKIKTGYVIYKAAPEEGEKAKEKPLKGIIYYTDNEADEEITRPVQEQLIKIAKEKSIPIVTAALKQRLDFGVTNLIFPELKRGMFAQFKQILSALKASTAEIIFFCEADILYHPSHFDFVPPKRHVYYYNVNVWKVRWSDGHALKVDDLKQLSGFCGYRDFLIRHYEKRIEIVEQRRKEILESGQPLVNDGVSRYMGFEPGMHSKPRGVDEYPVESWRSEFPNIDIRHDHNISKNRWTREEFQDKKYTRGWTESTADAIPGWEGFYTKLKYRSSLKGIIYFSDCQLDEKVAASARERLLKISQEKRIPIISATLKKMDFGLKNIHFPSLKPGYLSMFKQIMAALEHSTSEIIFFSEHDVLYHPSHFDFTPPDKNTFYYNQNVWFLRSSDGHAMHYDVNQVSGLCGFREALLTHYQERYKKVEEATNTLNDKELDKFVRTMGFEPMTHHRVKWQNESKLGTWKSKFPNIDIRHGENATGARWGKSQFRNQKLLINWQETDDEIPGWGKTKDLIAHF